MLEFLLAYGADPNIQDRWKMSAIDYAEQRKDSLILNILNKVDTNHYVSLEFYNNNSPNLVDEQASDLDFLT